MKNIALREPLRVKQGNVSYVRDGDSVLPVFARLWGHGFNRIERKEDGIRAILYAIPGAVQLRSRCRGIHSGELGVIDFPRLTDAVEAALSHGTPVWEDVVLDGELVADPPGTGRHSKLVVFDMLEAKGDLTGPSGYPMFDRARMLAVRFGAMKAALGDAGACLVPIEGHDSLSPREMATFYRRVMEGGGEGVMLKKWGARHDSGALWKVKRLATYDAVPIEMLPTPKSDGKPASLVVGQYRGEELVRVGKINLPVELREEVAAMLANGADFTVEFLAEGRTKNSYKFPRLSRIRTDKSQKECVLEEA